MAQGQIDRKRVGEAVRTLVMGLWLPALFLTGLLFSYMPAFHHPEPHHVSIAVAASPAGTARLQHELDEAAPGGFMLRPTADAAGARAAVLHHSAVAAYVPEGRHPLLYGAKADGTALETVTSQAFAVVAGRAGDTLAFRELVPTVPGDAPGSSQLYVVLSCVVAAYFMVVAMQRAVGFGLRAHIAICIGWGVVVTAVSYLAGAYVVQVMPPHPLDLLYLFLLTQAVSLTAYGLVPFFGGFFPGIAITLFVLLGVPSSGGAVPVQLLPGFFRFLHPILPAGNAADALRSVGYYGNSQLLRPTVVLCAWTAAGATLILLGYLRQRRRLVQEAADQTMTEYVPGPPAEDPTAMPPQPVALAPHQHHFGDEDPMLTGRVTDPSGQPLPGATVTVIDPHGRQLVRTRTDQNGEYAATGFSDVAAVVIAAMPGRPAAVAQILLDPAAPVNHDIVLGVQVPESLEPDDSEPRGRVTHAG